MIVINVVYLHIVLFLNTHEAGSELESNFLPGPLPSRWRATGLTSGPSTLVTPTVSFRHIQSQIPWWMRPIFPDSACATLGEIPGSAYSQLGSIHLEPTVGHKAHS